MTKMIHLDMYPFSICLGVKQESHHKMQRLVRRHRWRHLDCSTLNLDALGVVHAALDEKDEPCGLALMHLGDEITHALIAHEIVHLVSAICEFVHMKFDFDNDEPVAYLTGWLSNEIYKALKAWKVRIRVRPRVDIKA